MLVLLKQNIVLLISSIYLILTIINIFKYSAVKVNSQYYTNIWYFFILIIIPGILSFILVLFTLKTLNRCKLTKYRNIYNMITIALCPLSIFLFLVINIDLPSFSITPYISKFLMVYSVKYTLVLLALINLFYELLRKFSFKIINLPKITSRLSFFIKISLAIIIFFTLIIGYIYTSTILVMLLGLYLATYNENKEQLMPDRIALCFLLALIFLPLELLHFANTDILCKFILI